MSSMYDAVVVGAGPSGSAAAYEIAQAGFSVIMLEKHPRPGIPLCCAEAVPRAALERLVTVKKEWVSSYIDNIKVIAPNGEFVTIMHPGAGLVLDRKIFDNDLAQQAIQAGCKLRCETIGLELIRRGNLFSSLKILNRDESIEEISARVFIAADGVESKIARLAGIGNLVNDDDTAAYYQYRLVDIEIDSTVMEFHVGNEIAPGNYAWVFPKSSNSANAGVGVSVNRQKGNSAPQFLDRFVEHRFGKAVIAERFCGLVPKYQGKRMFGQKNLLVVGDAARVLDSLSGAGITNGMLSGKYAGQAAVKYLSGDLKNIDEIGQFYPGQFLKEKGEELALYARLRHVYSKLDDNDFIEIVRALNDYFSNNSISGVNAGRLLAGIMTTRPRLLRLIKHLI